ncbi:2-keto-4-pentenoate hydratase [Humitalea sp. 24SJ18S-53]|uniref:2-keto-4-pentenoate hydratase n=1 Tax=Humitalea sp. 24SJ18S-53 TaxID=3422307 RepID=UPI003D6799A8
MSDAASLILQARRARRMLAPLEALAPNTPAEGYAIQVALAGLMGDVPPAGFKIGATTAQMQAYLGLTGPAAGFVSAAGLHASGARLRFADFVNPGVECEIALRLGRDIAPAPCTIEQATAAIAEVFAGIEIVERRYDDFLALGAPTLIADQVFHAAGVTGAPAPGWPGIALKAARGRMLVDGVERGAGVGADLLGDPLAALAWLADSGAAHGFGGLRAGQIVFLGSVTPPIWLDGPCTVKVAFDLLGEVQLSFA